MNRPTHRGAPTLWKPDEDAQLCELVSLDRYSFSEIASLIGKTKGATIGRFGRLAAHLGWQAA